jgi:hypothetical protein
MRHFHLFQHNSGINKAETTRKFSSSALLLISLSLCLLLAACGDEAQADREATVSALGRAVVLTATAAADDALSPGDLLATAESAAAEALATSSAVSAEATETAVTATAAAAALPPTSESPPPPAQPGALSPADIGAELAVYGLDPSAGDIVWLQPEVVLAGEGLQRFQPDSPLTAVPLQNFVLTANIVLSAPATACGFALRASNLEQLTDQHLLLVGQTAPEPLSFQTWQAGALSPNDVDGVVLANPVDADPQFNLAGVNRLAVVVQNETFTVYTNGIQVAEFTPLTQLEAGLTALAVVGEGGTAVCRFANSWLWLPR